MKYFGRSFMPFQALRRVIDLPKDKMEVVDTDEYGYMKCSWSF